MTKKNFNLHSLTAQRLWTLSRQFNHDISEYAIREISQTLYKNNVYLLSGTQSSHYETTELMDNIYAVDPHGADHIIRSEAEHNMVRLLDGTEYLAEAENIIESAMYGGYSFFENPNTPQQKEWNFTIGSAPVIYVCNLNEFLPVDHPVIQNISKTGSIKRLAANIPR